MLALQKILLQPPSAPLGSRDVHVSDCSDTHRETMAIIYENIYCLPFYLNLILMENANSWVFRQLFCPSSLHSQKSLVLSNHFVLLYCQVTYTTNEEYLASVPEEGESEAGVSPDAGVGIVLDIKPKDFSVVMQETGENKIMLDATQNEKGRESVSSL